MSTEDDVGPGGRPPPAPPPPPPPTWGAAPPPYGYTPPQTDGKAVAALVCGIASFVFVPLVPAIVAVVLGSSSRKEIAASGGRLTGESLATTGLVMGWINIGLFAVGAVIAFVVLVLAAG